MRIADAARQYHVSEQAIRNRIRRAGYSLEALRKPGSGHFTEAGEQVIKSLYEGKEAATGPGKGPQKPHSTGKNTTGTLATVRAERDALQLRTATAEALAEERQKTIEILREQLKEKDAIITTLAAAAAARAALPEPETPAAAPDGRQTFRERLRAWMKGGKRKV